MKDQYGNEVPNDLVNLSCGPDRFNAEELEIIDAARWYGITHAWGEDLAVSFEEVQGLVDAPLGDTPIDAKYIDRVSHRWDEECGFYHV